MVFSVLLFPDGGYNINWFEFTASDTAVSRIADEISEYDVRIYPNPVNSYLAIELPNAQEASYSIINYTGQTVLSDDVDESSVFVDASNLVPGVYLIKVYNQNETYTEKIIKL